MTSEIPVAVVTGASSGVGLETAKALVAKGWRVIATGRSPERMAKAEAELKEASTTGQVDMLQVNLSLLADTAAAAEKILAMTDRLDVLVNNAGCMASDKVITAEGMEQNFTGNHLGPFLLTLKLLPLMKATVAVAPPKGVRIVNTSSDASEMIPGLNLDDLQNLDNYSNGAAYCGSKLANVLFARGLATRYGDEGIIAHSVHPGTVDSNFISYVDDNTRAYMETLEYRTAADAAETLVWLASAPEPGQSNGGYFCNMAPRKPNPLIDDPAYIDRMWEESEKLVAAYLN